MLTYTSKEGLISVSEDFYFQTLSKFIRKYSCPENYYTLPQVVAGMDPFFGTYKGLERWACLLSLEYLIRNVLMPDCEWSEGHSLMCRRLQATNSYMGELACRALKIWDKIESKKRRYLEKHNSQINKKRMLLMYRGYFKTTVFNSFYTIQELLIHKNLRKLEMSGGQDVAEQIIALIKNQFIYNEKLRRLFPEYCPTANTVGKIELGTKAEFTLPNRTLYNVKEPSIKAASPGTNLVGDHFEKIAFDDLINRSNVTTPDQLKKAKEAYSLCKFLYDNPTKPFCDIYGTHYSMQDLYMDIKKLQVDGSGEYSFTTFNPVTKKLEERRERLALQ